MLVKLLNGYSDLDCGWWLLLRFRPPKKRDISNILILKLTAFFGTLSGVVIAAIAHQQQLSLHLVASTLTGWIAFFVIYKITFAAAWNSRARRLRQNIHSGH